MIRGIVVVGTLLLGVGVVFAQQDVVNERSTLMKANARGFYTVLKGTARGNRSYEQPAIDAALNQLDETAKKLPTLFPDSTKGLKGQGDFSTSAKAWENKAGLNAAIADFAKVVADAKAQIKDADSLKTNVVAIEKSCDSCHDNFRVRN